MSFDHLLGAGDAARVFRVIENLARLEFDLLFLTRSLAFEAHGMLIRSAPHVCPLNDTELLVRSSTAIPATLDGLASR